MKDGQTQENGVAIGSTALFALFGGEAYYPGGGWHDFKGAFPSADTAKVGVNERWEFWHIVNLETREVVEHYGRTCYCEGCPPDESLYLADA